MVIKKTACLLIALAIRRAGAPLHLEQVVMERDDDQGYRLLARATLAPGDTAAWWSQ